MSYNTLLINIDELLLKGRNQNFFMEKLNNHVTKLLKSYHQGPFLYHRDHRRQIVDSEIPFQDDVVDGLLKVPGVHSLYLSRKVPLDFQAIWPALQEELRTMPTLPSTFRIQTKRAYKGLSMDSMTISSEIGKMVCTHFPSMKVHLKNPELVIDIKVMEKGIFLSTHKLKGVGGLPVGSSGHLICLLSGGFDSPVASFLMSKRGCRQSFAFFYAYPYVGEEVKKKILSLVKALSPYWPETDLYILPFGQIQKKISDLCRPGYRTLFFRKYMMEASSLLAEKIGAQGLVTGDSLGQVSSQTIGNLTLIEKSTPLPIFRPLIGLNKIEIINMAKKIGTHDISILPHDDACSLFASKHPITNPHKGYWDSFIENHSFQEELSQCLGQMEVHHFSLKNRAVRTLP